MKHKIIMRPSGFGSIPKKFIPNDAEVIGCATEASLMGTIYPDGKVYHGLLEQDKTFVIEDVDAHLINNQNLLYSLRTGKVDKRLVMGQISYDIKAKLILCTQPFKPTKNVEEVFDIKYWIPDEHKLMEVKD